MGINRMDLTDSIGEDASTTGGQVVTINRCDNCILQAHLLDRYGQSERLVQINTDRPARFDIAVRASSRADISENHEGGCSPIPALTDIRAGGFFADSVQPCILKTRLETNEIIATWHRYLEPMW